MMDTIKAQQIIAHACCILKDSKKHRSKNKPQTVILRPRTAVQNYNNNNNNLDLQLQQQENEDYYKLTGSSKYLTKNEIFHVDRHTSVHQTRPKTMSTSLLLEGARGMNLQCSSKNDTFLDSFECSPKADKINSQNRLSLHHHGHDMRGKLAELLRVHNDNGDDDVDGSEKSTARSKSRPQTTHPSFHYSNSDGYYWSSEYENHKDRAPHSDIARLRNTNQIMSRQRSESYICQPAYDDPTDRESIWKTFMTGKSSGSDSPDSQKQFRIGGIIMEDFKFTRPHHHIDVPQYVRQTNTVQERNYQEQLLAARRFRKKIIRPGGAENNFIGVRQPRY